MPGRCYGFFWPQWRRQNDHDQMPAQSASSTGEVKVFAWTRKARVAVKSRLAYVPILLRFIRG